MGIYIIIFCVYFLPFLVFLLPTFFHLDSPSKFRKKFGIACLLLVIGSIIGCYYIGKVGNNAGFSEEDVSVSKADGFYINSYDVTLDVLENNSIDVTEVININFYESGHHGIYRFIPEWYKYTDKDGNTTSRNAILSDLRVENDMYSIDEVKGKKRIKIGNPSVTLKKGDYNYVIKYNYDMGSDPYSGFDEFIFHAFGDYWGTDIKKPTVTINFPKDVDIKNNIKVFNDKYRKEDISSHVEYTYNKNSVKIRVKDDYVLSKSLTVDVVLNDGYFVGKTNVFASRSFYYCLIAIIISLVTFVLWLIVGKDYKYPQTVELFSPDKLDASEIGYIYKQETGKKLAVSLIVGMAAKGYFSIDKNGRKLTLNENLDNLEPLTENERIIFDGLFVDGKNDVAISSLKDFYKSVDKLNESLINKYDGKLYDEKAYNTMILTSILFIISNILLGRAYTVHKDLTFSLYYLYYIAFICNIVTLVFSLLMKRYKKYGSQLRAKINGFKDYIKLAEKDQIEAQAKEHPNYFYDILPFAYVLGITGVWISKFDKIPDPVYNMGTFNFSDSSSYDNIGSSLHTSAPSSSGSSGGCSSCGGGCSSCGGGCSSCGGGGSW